ncbi:MAG: hypothetical protein RLZZ280_1451, partial [Pseudomonadota bacterium]
QLRQSEVPFQAESILMGIITLIEHGRVYDYSI